MRTVELHESGLSYAAVMDALPGVSFIRRPDGSAVYLSRAWREFTGLTCEEGLAKGWALVHPDDLARAVQTWEEARASGTSHRQELRLLLGDGSYRWVLAQTDPMRADDGTIVGWIGTLTDQSAQRSAEDAAFAAMRESLERSHFADQLLDASEDCITVLDLDARLVSISTNGMKALGIADIETVRGHEWVSFWNDDERLAAEVAIEAARAGGRGHFTGGRAVDGAQRWWDVTVTLILDHAGQARQLLAVLRDITQVVRAQRADEEREQFVRLVEASDDYISLGDPAGNVVYLNQAGQKLIETGTPDEARLTNIWDYFFPEDLPFVRESVMPALMSEGRWRGELRLRNHRTGTPVPMWHHMFALHDESGAITGIATVSSDLRERYRVDVALRTLAQAGAALYESLDFNSTMRNVAAAVVGSFASFCTVEALDESGRIRSVAAAHRDPSLVPLIERAAEMRNDRPDHPIFRAIHHGEATLIEDLSPTWWDRFGQRDELGSQLDVLDMRSVIYVPIRSQLDGTIRGAMSCILAGSDPRVTYAAEDVRFAEEVAVRAGLAFDNARAYEREKRIAVTLQAASLPKALPTIDHLYLSADYRPGKSEATIGGDWYDAFALDDGCVAITVGDVLGNGLAAAVTMGRLRQSMRVVATLIAEPNAMLDAADRTVRGESDETYATALAGVFDPRTHTFTFASAGHPSPVLRHPDGRIEEFNVPGMMLGLRSGKSLRTVTIAVAPGSTLVFFTDGLTEATRDTDEGYRRLHAAMADAGVSSADNPAHALVEHVLRARPATDDIAVLVAEVGPSKRFDERLRTASSVAAGREAVTIATSIT